MRWNTTLGDVLYEAALDGDLRSCSPAELEAIAFGIVDAGGDLIDLAYRVDAVREGVFYDTVTAILTDDDGVAPSTFDDFEEDWDSIYDPPDEWPW